MANIIRHCRDWKQPIASDTWLLQKLAELGKLNQENIQIIAKYAGVSVKSMEQMLQETALDAAEQLEPGFQELVRKNLVGEAVEVGKSENVRQVMQALQNQAKDVLNLCNTTMLYKAKEAYQKLTGRIVSQAQEIEKKQSFLDTLDKHATAAVIGAQSRQQAVTQCIREFNEKGIPAFVDKAGREWTPEAYVNMVMRNTASNVATEVAFARIRDSGTDLFAVASHPGSRPKCAKDQGKIYSLSNKSGYTEDLNGKKIRYYPWKDSSYGEPDGIYGINCGHGKPMPFIPGVNIQRYFPTEDFEENDRLYKETQVQRALERAVRKQKRECMLLDEMGEKEAFQEAAVKLKQKEAKLGAYVDSKDHLHRRKDREQVVGFDKSVSAKAVAANKKVQKELAQKAKDDKIKAEIKAAGMKGEIELSPKKKIDVSNYTFDEAHINKEREHNVSREDAERFIREADVAITRWNGHFVNYYSPNGAVFVDTENENIRTAFRKEEFDDHVKKMREVLEENGRD